jgi:hypothetical protein
MVGFKDYGDFADYFGPRWHYKLKNAIAEVPQPFRFLKGDFEWGRAVRILQVYASAPESYLDEQDRAKLAGVSRELWRRLEETFEENSEDLVLLRAQRLGDNAGDGPASKDGLQADLFADPYMPF